jgi:hypothetical protein
VSDNENTLADLGMEYISNATTLSIMTVSKMTFHAYINVNMLSVAVESIVPDVHRLNVMAPNYYKNEVHRMGLGRMLVWSNPIMIGIDVLHTKLTWFKP